MTETWNIAEKCVFLLFGYIGYNGSGLGILVIVVQIPVSGTWCAFARIKVS